MDACFVFVKCLLFDLVICFHAYCFSEQLRSIRRTSWELQYLKSCHKYSEGDSQSVRVSDIALLKQEQEQYQFYLAKSVFMKSSNQNKPCRAASSEHALPINCCVYGLMLFSMGRMVFKGIYKSSFSRRDENKLRTAIYRKLTHTDRLLDQ